MAFIRHRGKTYSVVYKILDENGEEHTTSETFATQKEADKRKKEIEYKQSIGKFEVQKCATLKELIEEYVQIYGHDKWGVSTYSGNVALINNYILPTIGDTKLASINTHFMEKYYKDLLKMPAVKSTKNPDGTGTITESTVNEIHKVLRSCFRQAVKWDMMEKNPAVDATVPKAKKQEREIWTAEMLMQALEACDNKMLKIAFHLAFTATLRIGDDDDKIRLNQRKPSKYKGLSRFGPEKNLQRINKFMKERPIFYKNLIQMKENFRFYLRCFYCITKVVILQFNSEKQDRISS